MCATRVIIMTQTHTPSLIISVVRLSCVGVKVNSLFVFLLRRINGEQCLDSRSQSTFSPRSLSRAKSSKIKSSSFGSLLNIYSKNSNHEQEIQRKI